MCSGCSPLPAPTRNSYQPSKAVPKQMIHRQSGMPTPRSSNNMGRANTFGQPKVRMSFSGRK